MPTQPAVLHTARLNNFRLNYLTREQAFIRPAYVWVILGGVRVSDHVLYKSVRIRDLVFDAPNTCSLTFYGLTPAVGQPLDVWVDSNKPTQLFSGELQTVGKTYAGKPTTVKHPCTAIDDTARANRRRPLGLFTNVSATTIAQTLIATYAPGMSAAGVELGLPAITVNFDGSEAGMKGCLTQIAKLIGGYWFFENKTLYLFITPPGPAPDPIDDTPGRFLHDPPITWTIDKSQVRTRVFGKGASTQIAATVDPGTVILPVDNSLMFNATGGKAIAGTTKDGAASQVLTYTGVHPAGGGGLVGPGASPSAAPGLAAADGAGVESGLHDYAVTYTTALGETRTGPRATINVGFVAPPATAPVPGSPTSGGALDVGTHLYGVTFVTAIGETNLIDASAPVTIAAPMADPDYGTFAVAMTNSGTGGPYPFASGGLWKWAYTFVTAGGETLPSPLYAFGTGAGGPFYAFHNALPIGPAGTTARKIYRTLNHGSQLRLAVTIPNNTSQNWEDKVFDASLGANAPTVNTTSSFRTVPLTNIPRSPGANVTARRIYRYFTSAPAGWRLVTTIPNNTATTYADSIANATLGASPPAANTATANQVTVTVPIGGPGVTGRRVYRTAAGGSALKVAAVVADNVTTTITDAAPDATLGAAEPTADTSGLKQPEGQAQAGSTELVVANPSAFAPSGGWAVIGNGEQVIRYTGVAPDRLTGIPATGSGAITATVSFNSTVTVSPALTGVTGLVLALQRGAPIHVWVQRDDVAAQENMIVLDGGGDGIYEHIVSDDRRSEASLVQVCDAELELYSRPLVSVVYASRDTKTKSGKTVSIAIATPAIVDSLTIQDVSITEIGIAKGLRPKYTATASSVRHSFDAILRQLLRKAEA